MRDRSEFVHRALAILAAVVASLFEPLVVRAQPADDQPLIIEALDCRGAVSTSCAYILSYVSLRVGDPIDEDALRDARFRLSALPSFNSVRVVLERGSERGKANVIIEVVEASPLLAEGLARAANHGANVLGGRVSHQSLLGSGERLDFSAILRSEVDGPVKRETQYALLQYVDPNLFAVGPYFLIASVGDNDDTITTRYDDEVRFDTTSIGVSIGRRIADFSYLALRYEYLPNATISSRVNNLDGSITIEEISFDSRLSFDYGWNSEDDPYFPTQGGRFNLTLAILPLDSYVSTDPEQNDTDGPGIGLAVGYRHIWSFAPDAYWTLDFGSPGTEYQAPLDEGFLVSFGHARSLKPQGFFSGLRRGRWYVEGGWNWLRLGDGHEVQEAGFEGGLRLNTKAFGMVELSLRATTEIG